MPGHEPSPFSVLWWLYTLQALCELSTEQGQEHALASQGLICILPNKKMAKSIFVSLLQIPNFIQSENKLPPVSGEPQQT